MSGARHHLRFGMRTLLGLVLLAAFATAWLRWPDYHRYRVTREIQRRGGTIEADPTLGVVTIHFPNGSDWPEVGELELFQVFPHLERVGYGTHWLRRKLYLRDAQLAKTPTTLHLQRASP